MDADKYNKYPDYASFEEVLDNYIITYFEGSFRGWSHFYKTATAEKFDNLDINKDLFGEAARRYGHQFISEMESHSKARAKLVFERDRLKQEIQDLKERLRELGHEG